VSRPSDDPLHRRVATTVLGWGQPRPVVDHGAVPLLWRSAVQATEPDRDRVAAAAARARHGRLLVTHRTLERRVCDGWQRDPLPPRPTRAAIRGALVRRAVAADWAAGRRRPVGDVVAEVWHDEATRRAGDPTSRSRWLNERAPADARALREEVADLVLAVREVWPPLPDGEVVARFERPVSLPVLGGRVLLRDVPALVLDSPRRDDRARSVVVDLVTGPPRPVADRRRLRFAALLVALADGRWPYRWVTHHVVDGRTEVEELDPGVLGATADEVVDAIVHLATVGTADEETLRLQGGAWCRWCARVATCPAAEVAGVSHPSGRLTP
jgi:hypothetical protein